MTGSTSLSLRVVGTMVAAAIVVLGMPTPPASAAPLDHVTITATTPAQVEGNSGTTSVSFAIAYTGHPTAFSIDWATIRLRGVVAVHRRPVKRVEREHPR
jgi:hypothetical protein